MAVVTTNLGVITAYGDAVAAGYTGTKAQWQALMANYATVGQQAAQDAQTASTAASTATSAANTATTKASEASASATAAEQAAASIGTPDTTLTQSGKAADAKKTGDEISQIKEDFNDMVNSAYVTDSASGSVAHFVDGADDVPMKSVVIDTESASATVTRTGKNLVDFADLACEANIQNTTVLGTVCLPAGTYTFSADIDKNINATRNRLRIAYDDVVVYGTDFLQIGRSSYTFTLDSAKTVTLSWWYHTLSASIVLSDIQLEYASADTEYEAYNGNTYNVTLVNGVVQEEIKSLLGINNVWSDAGDMDVEYRADTKLYINKRLAEVTS